VSERDSFSPPAAAVTEAVARALAEDLGPLGDITAALLPDAATGSATVVAREAGVLAGTACATEVFYRLDPDLDIQWNLSDGERLSASEVVGVVKGRLASIVTAERTVLNFLCHLSGVASATRRFVDLSSAPIADTRKTLPGLRALEKAAVRAGGGVNHRSSLSEMVLIKDNYLVTIGIAEAVARARDLWPDKEIEVECDSARDVDEAVSAGADIVMLDNMSPEEVEKCVLAVRSGRRPKTRIEVSGGVSLATVADYARSRPDLISTSAITQSAPALDLAFDRDFGGNETPSGSKE
jgi:nicotinate-nucleotide pyrophosphorylase (carboxylating)